MKINYSDTAQEYADIIAKEISELDHVANGAPYGFQPDDSTTDDDEAAEYRHSLINLEMTHDIEQPLENWLNGTALDLAILRDTRGGEFGQRIEILRTCGGPTCYITRDSNDGDRIEIRVSDGQHQFTKSLWLPNIPNYLDELAENQ
jgi:hypothetical protein